MFELFETTDQKERKRALRLKELVLEMENLDRLEKELRHGLPPGEERPAVSLDNKENFTKEEWEVLEELKKWHEEIKEKLGLSSRTPTQPKKTLNLDIRSHWIHVR